MTTKLPIRFSYDNGKGSSYGAAWFAIYWGKGAGYIGGHTFRVFAGPAWHRWNPREWLRVARAIRSAKYALDYDGSGKGRHLDTYRLLSIR